MDTNLGKFERFYCVSVVKGFKDMQLSHLTFCLTGKSKLRIA